MPLNHRPLDVPLPERPSAPHTPLVDFEVRVEPWLFGGGATTRKPDPVTPIRPSSVLGQLRFFWRLLWPFGAERTSLEDFRSAEETLFGSDKLPAAFGLVVRDPHPGRAVEAPRMNDPGGYLAFPARGERGGAEAMTLYADVTGRIVVAARENTDELRRQEITDKLRRQLLPTVDLWSIVGGVGGRTRRGLGAVQRPGWAAVATEDALREHLQGLLAGRPTGPKFDQVRSIERVYLSQGVFKTAIECLGAIETWYKGYRQDRRPGKNPPKPGRSWWDEPEEIRRKTGWRHAGHPPLPKTTRHASGWARGVLGLPIVFHFKDRDDPPTTMLKGAGAVDRFASALLFRPVRLGAGGYVAVVAKLSGPYLPPGGPELKSERRSGPVDPTPEVDRVWDDLFAAGRSGRLALTPLPEPSP